MAKQPNMGDRGIGTQKFNAAEKTQQERPYQPTPGRQKLQRELRIGRSLYNIDSNRPTSPQGQVKAFGRNVGNHMGSTVETVKYEKNVSIIDN
jgi:hypothetical protein